MRNSAIARLCVMGVLTVLLLVPLAMVESIVSERANRRDSAVSEVSATWGAPQTLGGPVLSIPYTRTWIDSAGHPQQCIERVHILATSVHIDGTAEPEQRSRGIFDVVVYRTEFTISGRFVRPDLAWLKVSPSAIDWERATLSLGVTDPKGLTRRAVLEWNEQPSPFSGGVADVGLFTAGIQAPAPGLAATAPNAEIPFSMVIGMNGTRDLRFLPAAQETTIGLTSRWPHPGFTGSPLPQTRTTGDAGFTAQWTAMDFGRSYPAVWTSAEMDRKELLAKADASAFGVSLLQPVDIYHQTERAVKYAALFIVLTFLVFFLWELFQAALLHPVQYAFVGFALCLYYLLLVSLSEHVGFDTAYVISSVCATALIGGYSRAVLHGTMRAASVIASLAALYGFLFLLLRLEDYALVAGAAGLFAVLALVMFVTRRMDWYDLRLGTRGTEAVVK